MKADDKTPSSKLLRLNSPLHRIRDYKVRQIKCKIIHWAVILNVYDFGEWLMCANIILLHGLEQIQALHCTIAEHIHRPDCQ